MSFMEFLFSSFWVFFGTIFITAGFAFFVYRVLSLYWRHRNIVKSGYPPAHCDAYGFAIRKDRLAKNEKKSLVPRIKDIKLFHGKRPDSTPADNPLKSFNTGL